MKSKQSEKQPGITGERIRQIHGLENISDELADKMATTIKQLAEIIFETVASRTDLKGDDDELPYQPPKN